MGTSPETGRSRHDKKPRNSQSCLFLLRAVSDIFGTLQPKKRARHGVWREVATEVDAGSHRGNLSVFTRSRHGLTRSRHGLWGGLST